MAKVTPPQELQSLAYFDGQTVEQIAELDLTETELRTIAGWCGKYAYDTARLDSREAYLERAEALSLLAIEAYIMNVELPVPPA